LAKERQMKKIELESITVDLPLVITHGEHRKIERMTIRLAADDYAEIKDTFGASLEELQATATAATGIQTEVDSSEMNDHEVMSTLVILTGMSVEDVDNIDRNDFETIQNVMQNMYRKKSAEDRAEGKDSSGPNMRAVAN